MILQCSGCKKIVGEEEPLANKTIKPVVCPDCKKLLLQAAKGNGDTLNGNGEVQ